jgi:nucleotide-binding universal stress UspA family protein
MPAQRVILCPTDFSPSSMKAFEVAGAMARDRSAPLVVLHVAPKPLSSLGGTQAVPPMPDEINLKDARDQLARITAPAGVSMETRLEMGEAAPIILSVARDTNCQLIVMGTHGRSGLGRLLMGSVAEEVVRKAPCPVLTLKAEAPAK